MQTTNEKMGRIRRALLRKVALMKRGTITPAWELTPPRDRTHALRNIE